MRLRLRSHSRRHSTVDPGDAAKDVAMAREKIWGEDFLKAAQEVLKTELPRPCVRRRDDEVDGAILHYMGRDPFVTGVQSGEFKTGPAPWPADGVDAVRERKFSNWVRKDLCGSAKGSVTASAKRKRHGPSTPPG